jgi:hypothetical protein
MIPRRPSSDEPDVIPIRAALAWERSGAWPDARTRNQFWSRRDVPKGLRSTHQPDPRPVLSGDIAAYDRALERWHARRIAWLEARV